MNRNINVISAYVALMSILIILPFFSGLKYFTVTLGGITLCTTLFFGFLNYQHIQDRLFKDLFKEFNERYDKLNEYYPHFVEHKNDIEYADIDPKDVQIIINYLNLCAEQYFWFEKGRIDSDAWNSWKSGMQTWARLPVVKKVFEIEVATWTTSYYLGFQAFFTTLPDIAS